MLKDRTVRCTAAWAMVLGTAAAGAAGEEVWEVRAASVKVMLDTGALNQHGLSVTEMTAGDVTSEFELPFVNVEGRLFSVRDGGLDQPPDASFDLSGGITLVSSVGPHPVFNIAVFFEGATVRAPHQRGERWLELRDVKTGWDGAAGVLSVYGKRLSVPRSVAREMGRPDLADVSIGRALITIAADWSGGDRPRSVEEDWADGGAEGEAEAGGSIGPDVTFCQLYDLRQYGRVADVVGLAIATTSWNVGTEDVMWFPIPNSAHPFIVMNLYRLRSVDGSERFEQIGQSWIKHAFYALGSHQCGGPPCTYEPGHSAGNWLGTGCTDTYVSSLNASQSGLGPRYEVNPWNGAWSYAGSHNSQGAHTHDAVEHRLQVHDADLDASTNPGATYYGESIYVASDDVDVMNSVAWKPTTVSGSPGGTWTFGMSGSGTYPTIGLGLDAWTGAQQTVIAQEVPVVEFESPDGRCVLAAKSTELGGGMYHYEYALLNVDMDRQVGSFSIPISEGATVTNVGFHAVEHHDEPFNTVAPDAVPIDNAPWTASVTDYTVTWTTTTNPLRWGTLYNFRFDADVGPVASTATLGLFRPGSPSTLTGETIGPYVGGCLDAADCCDTDANGTTDDICTWCQCLSPACSSMTKVAPSDIGGSFGACMIDGFCNIHDANHALACFSGTSDCDDINLDAGGPFGDCGADGFCNIHDANHALSCFAGMNSCTCPPAPAPESAHFARVAGKVSLTVQPDRRVARPGDTVSVRVFVNEPVAAIQSYQLHLAPGGGRSGRLDLVDVVIEERGDFVFAGVEERFDAFNVAKGQMLAGLLNANVSTGGRGYLATYTYEVSRDASGVFVIDILHDARQGDQTFLIASFTDQIEVSATVPAVVTVSSTQSAMLR